MSLSQKYNADTTTRSESPFTRGKLVTIHNCYQIEVLQLFAKEADLKICRDGLVNRDVSPDCRPQ